MLKTILTSLVVTAVVVAGAFWVFGGQGGPAGGTTNFDDLSLSGDLTTGDDLVVTDDATVSGGTFTVTTSNSATSTASLGCVQTTATSTQTPIRLLFTASTTATAISGTQAGFVLWGYGTCPF